MLIDGQPACTAEPYCYRQDCSCAFELPQNVLQHAPSCKKNGCDTEYQEQGRFEIRPMNKPPKMIPEIAPGIRLLVLDIEYYSTSNEHIEG